MLKLSLLVCSICFSGICQTLSTPAVAGSLLWAAPASGSSAQSAGALRNGLPPTTMDSFVYEAKEHAAHIYGDEGTDGLPPYYGFDEVHRINKGIMDQRDAGLTTGHGWYAPCAWGRDEFLGQEWSDSGANGASSNGGSFNPVDDQSSVGSGGNGGANLPPAPGPGWQPMYQHGEFVGWYSPEEVALSQTDFAAALRSVVNSDHYYGGELGRLSILYEIGDIDSPFP